MTATHPCRTSKNTIRGTSVSPLNYPLNQLFRFDGERFLPRPRAKGCVLIRPVPGYYVLRLVSRGPVVPALIFQRCPMVLPQPGVFGGPDPDEWCRSLDRSPVLQAQVDGKSVQIDCVWTARALRSVSAAEYAFRIGPLQLWARSARRGPEARPHRTADLAAISPLF